MKFRHALLWFAISLFVVITGLVTYERGTEGFGIFLIVYGVVLYFNMPGEKR